MMLRNKVLVLIAIFYSCTIMVAQSPAFLKEHNRQWVDSVFNTLNLEEKIGQLLLPRGNYSGKPYDVPTLEKWVREYKIGGIVFFASNPSAQASLTNKLQAMSRIPLIIGQDSEWGVGMRLDSTDRFPYAMALGAIEGNDGLIEAMGREIASQCQRIGVHINYAPVVDINNNPNNPVINFRSFGENKFKVAEKGLAYMKGMQGMHLITTAKHFPGHGNTDVDSHHDLPVLNHNRQQLEETELYPFKKLIESGLSGIMTAHLNIPELDPTPNLASTFSSKIIYKLLREDLRFKGLIFTDAMDMQGAIKNFPKGEAMVMALLAGNDILETFMDVPETILAIRDAVLQGRIPMEVLDNKVKKILMAKSWVGLDKYKPIEMENLVEDLNTINADVLNNYMAEKSITCVKNDLQWLPLKDLTKKMAVLSVESDNESDFYRMVNNYVDADFYHIPKNASDSLVSSVFNNIKDYDILLTGIHLIDIRASKKYGLTSENSKIIANLAQMDNVVLCLFGNPLILGKIPELALCKHLILGYQQSKYAENAAAQIIFGSLPASGKLPLNITSDFKIGMGFSLQSLNRLSYGEPEMVGVDRVKLSFRIDSLMSLAISKKAFPGGIVQVAKNGKVIFKQAYGFHTYEAQSFDSISRGTLNKSFQFIDDAMDNNVNVSGTLASGKEKRDIKGRVQLNDIYDLASVTKIITSTLAVMQLMTDGLLSLDCSLGEYFPDFKYTNKGELKMKDLLTHRSGLTPWIPFWLDAVDTISTMKKALILNPALEKKCIITMKKPGFLIRLFGKKMKKEVQYLASLSKDKSLWSQMLSPRSITWKSGIFSNIKSSQYSVKVTDSMWLNKNYRQKIIKQIADSPLNLSQTYLYSDLHYYLYPDIVFNLTGMHFEKYLQETYLNIGASSLMYNPHQKVKAEKIIPTEYDSLFRKTLLHGFVHDEGAAMFGGVSGHAGLFGNANDVTKILQMYLQKGSYGGISFIDPEIIDYCTSYQFPFENNRRGIGFDKKDFDIKIMNGPSLASNKSYGHSGFTGTFAWVDPEYDLVYLLLSNRVYPTRKNNLMSTLNIRQEIGNQIIKSIQESGSLKEK